MICKQQWYVLIVFVSVLGSSSFAAEPEDVYFAQWQSTFKGQMVKQAERLSNDTFTEAFVRKYELLRSQGMPHYSISFVGMSEFREWLIRFADEDFDMYLAAVLAEFTPEQQRTIKQRLLNRQAPYIYLVQMDPLATIQTPEGRLTLDPTLPGLTYAALRELLVHEYTHYLAQGYHYSKYVALTEGMTQYLTRRVGIRCQWGLHHPKVYPDEVRITALLIHHGNGQLKDWFINHNVSNDELFDVLVTQLAVGQSEEQRRTVEEVVMRLQGLPPNAAYENLNERKYIESVLARPKPKTLQPPILATAR